MLGTCNFEEIVTSWNFGYLLMLLHFGICKNFSFRLTCKSYPKFSQISTMECVIKSAIAHILRSD